MLLIILMAMNIEMSVDGGGVGFLTLSLSIKQIWAGQLYGLQAACVVIDTHANRPQDMQAACKQ